MNLHCQRAAPGGPDCFSSTSCGTPGRRLLASGAYVPIHVTGSHCSHSGGQTGRTQTPARISVTMHCTTAAMLREGRTMQPDRARPVQVCPLERGSQADPAPRQGWREGKDSFGYYSRRGCST